MADLAIREALQDDLEILWEFLAIATYQPDAATVKAVPDVAECLTGGRGPDDFGSVAEWDGVVIGAAWARQFSPDNHKIVHGDDRTPMISIGGQTGRPRPRSRRRTVARADHRGQLPGAWPLSERAQRKPGMPALRAPGVPHCRGLRRPKPPHGRHLAGDDPGMRMILPVG
jgi:hypothetical protein